MYCGDRDHLKKRGYSEHQKKKEYKKIVIMKNILVQFTFPDSDIKIYETVAKELEEAGMGKIPERLYHVSAQDGNGWHVTDVWESQEAFDKFSETLMPLHIKSGGDLAEPTILNVHSIIIPD